MEATAESLDYYEKEQRKKNCPLESNKENKTPIFNLHFAHAPSFFQ
jgi:hypothetical protein